MSFTLMDLSSENFEFRANVWNWKPTLEIIKSFDIMSDGKLRQMEYNATGVSISKEEAHEIGEKIRDENSAEVRAEQTYFYGFKRHRRARRRNVYTRTRTNSGKITARLTTGSRIFPIFVLNQRVFRFY